MALVFKIKHQETLRRWVVSQTLEEKPSAFALTVDELESKIRDLFHLASNEVLLITYVDKEGDVITLADDQDLIDACLVQRLNPLRLDVQISEHKPNPTPNPNPSSSPNPNPYPAAVLSLPNSAENGNTERSSKPPFPQVTADAIKQFLSKHTQAIDPNLQPAVLFKNFHQALKAFLKTLVHEGQRLAPRRAVSAESPSPVRCTIQPWAPRSPIQDQCNKDDSSPILHVGVQCDGCGMHPIQGPRYKSSKVFNYDLCSSCFEETDNKSDYQKMEHPVLRVPWHGFYHPSCPGGGPRMPMRWGSPFASGIDGWKSECPFLRTQSGHPTDMSKHLDASFVKDMTVFDGAELAPCTEFTKIWRLKNIGSIPWPQGTYLAHIAGDKLSVEEAIDLKLPEAGLLSGVEFDVSVDLRAPDTAGNYVSHWCLMAPSGEKFGHSVWVAIQVAPQGSESLQMQASCIGDDKAEVVEEPCKIEGGTKPVIDVGFDMNMPASQGMGHEGMNIDDDVSVHNVEQGSLFVNSVDKASQTTNAAQVDQDDLDSVDDEEDGFSVIEKPIEKVESFNVLHAGPPVSVQLSLAQQTNVLQEQYAKKRILEISNQELQLHLLETMGFTNRNLNSLLLDKNNQDLQLTVDDLLLGAGWDSLLKDLQEMGFSDTFTNLRLLIKNEGSIKRVVKELVEMEKQ